MNVKQIYKQKKDKNAIKIKIKLRIIVNGIRYAKYIYKNSFVKNYIKKIN